MRLNAYNFAPGWYRKNKRDSAGAHSEATEPTLLDTIDQIEPGVLYIDADNEVLMGVADATGETRALVALAAGLICTLSERRRPIYRCSIGESVRISQEAAD